MLQPQTPGGDAASTILIPGPKTLLIGGTGTGKTHCLRTLVDAGLEVFALFTEPGMEVLADIPPEKLHWNYIPPAAPDWSDMIDSAKKINTMSLKALSGLEDINKRKYQQFFEMLEVLSNFKCQRTGQSYGPVDSFGAGRALVVDSLSGVNVMAMNLVTGSKPVKSMADWGMAMDNLERFIQKLTVDVPCPVVVIAHAERETDEVTGGTTVMASTLGKKLAPRIPRFFSDVINVKREGADFSWSTMTHGMDLKARNIPYADKIPPTFVPIIRAWQTRNTQALAARAAGGTPPTPAAVASAAQQSQN